MPSQIQPMQRSTSDTVLRALVDDASQQIVAQVLPMFTEAFRMMVEKVNAQIVVNTPAVSVAAPSVSSPVSVTVPEMEPPEVTVNMSMDQMCNMLGQTNALLARLIQISEQSVTRTVTRDKNGLITEIKEVRV